jgi:hypothetical protein
MKIYSPRSRSLTRAESDSHNDDSEISALESDSSALAMLKNQIREFDDILHDLDVTCTSSDNNNNHNDDDSMKQELGTLSLQEKMLKEEMDMIDVVISQTGSIIDNDNDSSQRVWKENLDIEPQEREMDLDWQQEPESEVEEQQQQQQQPHHEYATIRKELREDTDEGEYRYTTEEAEMDTTTNNSIHGCAPSLCGVCYGDIFRVPTMVVSKNIHSQCLDIPAGPETQIVIAPLDDDTRQVAHDKEQPVRGGETRERADSFHYDDDPTSGTCSQSDIPGNEEQDQSMENERTVPHVGLLVLRSDDTEENAEEEDTFETYSTSPTLDHVISDIASETYEPDILSPCSAYSEATWMYLCSAFRDDISISEVLPMQHMTIEGIHSQLDGSRSNSKDGSIILLQICRSDDDDDGDESITTSQICRSESGGGDGSQSMKLETQLTIGSSETSGCSQSMENEKDQGSLATSIESIIFERKHSQSFDPVCRSQFLDESERNQIYEDQAKDTTTIATDTIATIDNDIGNGIGDGKDGEGAALSCSFSAENQSSFANNISQSAVDPEEERREQEDTSRFVFNLCACVYGTVSKEKIDTVKSLEDTTTTNNNNNTSEKRMETVQENPTAEACLSKSEAGSSIRSIEASSHPQVWEESCIDETVNSKIISHGSREPPKEIDATSTQEKAGEHQTHHSRNALLEKETMKLINQAIDDLAIVIDDNVIDPGEIGEAYTEESQAEVTALDYEMQAVESSISMLSQLDYAMSVIMSKVSIREEPEGQNDGIVDHPSISTSEPSADDERDETPDESSKGTYDTFEVPSLDKPMAGSTRPPIPMKSTIEEPYEVSSLDKLETDSMYLRSPTKSIVKGKAPEWAHLPTAKSVLRVSALEYELQFSDSLLGSSSHLETFDALQQVSAQMSPSPSSSHVGTFFEASEHLSGDRIDKARRGNPANLTALEYEMQFSEDDTQLCSPTDEEILIADSYDEDPEEIWYRKSVLEARTQSILDSPSRDTASDDMREDSEEVESKESYFFSEAPLETPTSEDSVDIPINVFHKPEPKIEVDTRQPIGAITPLSRETCESKCKDIMSFEEFEDRLETPTSEDSIDIPMIVARKLEPKIEVETRQPIVAITSLSREACESKYKDMMSFEEVGKNPLEFPTSEDTVDIPMIVRHTPEPNIKVDRRQPIVATIPPSGEACKSKYKDIMSFEAVESVPSDELPTLDRQDGYLSLRARYGLSESLSDAPSDEMKSENSASASISSSLIDNTYYSEANDHENDLAILKAKINGMEVISTTAINISESTFIAERVPDEATVEVSAESDGDTVLTRVQPRCEVTNDAVDTKEVTLTGEDNHSEGGNVIAASASNEGSVEVFVESDGDTVITRVQSSSEVTNDAVDTNELTSIGEDNQSEVGNVIAANVSNEESVEVSVESDDDTVITRVQSRCEVTNDAVDTKDLTSTGEANQSEGGKVSENDREVDCVTNSSGEDNRAATPEGSVSRDPLDHFPSLKEALSPKSIGRRKKEVQYVKEARSPLRFLFGCPENPSVTKSDEDAPANGNPGVSEVATGPEETVAVAESAAIDGSSEIHYFSRLYLFATRVTCGIVGDAEVEVQAAEPNTEMTAQSDSNESSEMSLIKDERDNDGMQASAQKDHSGILNAVSYRSYVESVREFRRELASNTGKARLVFETEEEREIEAVLSDKLWLLGESVSIASSTNSAFGSTTLPNDVRDDDGLDIRSWDRQARELLQQNELLLQSMANSDFASYQKCVADDMTGIDAGSKSQSAKRNEFHQNCFDSSEYQTYPVTVSIVSPNIRFLSPDAAITSYTRIDQFIRDGKPQMIQTSESRVWQKRGESWVNCHFHQS